MPYSNIFDLMRKIIICGISMIISVPVFCYGFDRPNESTGWLLFWFVCGFAVIGLTAWPLAKWVLTNTFHSFIYIRFSLFTAITVREARELAPLFSIGPQGKWYPCREVLDLPRGERKAILYATLERYKKGLA
jgi:hypothetical protein